MDTMELTAGADVGHANPELADWRGTITLRRNGNWRDHLGYVSVKWHAGTASLGEPLRPVLTWVTATALTLAGECPDCARPAHYIFARNDYDRSEGWHHDERHDAMTCWAGKAAFEARRGT